MPICIFCLILGMWSLSYCRQIPSFLFCEIVSAGFLLCTFCIWWFWKSNHLIVTTLVAFTCLSIGMLRSDYSANQWLENKIPFILSTKAISVTGKIINLPLTEGDSTQFILQTILFNGNPQKKRLLIHWMNPHPPLNTGQYWQFSVRLKPPHSLVNFGTLNRLRLWWAPQQIHGVGYVVPKQKYQLLSQSRSHLIDQIRARLHRTIISSVNEPTLAAFITALTIGVEQGLDNQDWQILQRTGTVHLVVVAGLHIGLMVSIVYFVSNRLWRCFPKLLLYLPAQHAGLIIALCFAILYGMLAGFTIPTQRALLMLILAGLAKLNHRLLNEWRKIGLSFATIILIEPGALFTAALWLSFGAVFWITYSLNAEWRTAPHWKQWLRIQWGLFLGLMPLTIYFFHQFSLISLLANLPAIFWIGCVIVPLCLLAASFNMINLIYLSQKIFLLSSKLLQPLWDFLKWLSEINWAGGVVSIEHEWVMIMAFLGAAWCLAPKKYPLKWIGMFGLVPVWLIHPPKPLVGSYWLTMLDVGEGLSVVIQTAHHLMIYDTGARLPLGFDAGRDVVAPYLRSLNIKKIDLLMISHSDNDHSGGANYLLKNESIERFLTSIPSFFHEGHAQNCKAGQHWLWDGIEFKVLSPAANSIYKDNDSSCVLQIGPEGSRTLLTGDIESGAEKKLVLQYGPNLAAEILQVPHHGSRTSSTDSFLDQVKPKYALFSEGYINRFHFPAPSVLKRYQMLNTVCLLTSKNGALKAKVTPSQSLIWEMANPQRYFWEVV